MFGGAILTRGSLLVKVGVLGEHTAINQIISLVETAQSAKAPIQGAADNIARYFVPTIVTLAILTWTFWFTIAYSDYGLENL